MIKRLIYAGYVLLGMTACTALNKDDASVGYRPVTYAADTSMPGVELVVSYSDRYGEYEDVVVDRFPWTYETHILPTENIYFKGYARYKDPESEEKLPFVDLKTKIDVKNQYLNRGDTVSIQEIASGISNEDLRKNTVFDLCVEPIDVDDSQDMASPSW